VAFVIGRQALAIVWAQWRSLANYHGRAGNRRFPITVLFALVWYGLWAFLSFAVARMTADPESLPLLITALPGVALLIFIYWQIVPILMVSTGVSLDLSRLLVYPVPHLQMFTIEVILRVTTCGEMLLLSAGFGYGVLRNPVLPNWGVLSILVFACCNLFVSAGLKDLLGRLLLRRGYREALVFFLVLLAALPQLLLVSGPPKYPKAFFEVFIGRLSPWGATARLVLGNPDTMAMAALAFWTAVAWYFGRNQFERTLHFDAAETKATGRSERHRNAVLDALLSFMSRMVPDPLAALVEKEIRFLSRSARFRLLFLMGFSFGLLIWLPMTLRRDPDSFLRTNYLTVVSGYALMLLGEVCFWNNLGMDRSAAQAYFTMPVSFATVLRAKNIAAVFFVLLELSMVALFCALLRMPVTIFSVVEAFAVTLVFATYLLSFGNLVSIRYPRPVDPAQSWRSGSVGRAQAYLLLLYPAAAAPIALAFGAQFAFDSRAAFYIVLLIVFLIALLVYSIALESSSRTAEANKEFIVMTLSKSEGPAGS
jgi:ABC-2 type transport system permease protein